MSNWEKGRKHSGHVTCLLQGSNKQTLSSTILVVLKQNEASGGNPHMWRILTALNIN